jgi:hypothetical protein
MTADSAGPGPSPSMGQGSGGGEMIAHRIKRYFQRYPDMEGIADE